VAQVRAPREEPKSARASVPALSGHLLREGHRQQRRAWAQGSSPWRQMPVRNGVGARGWSVNVAMVERARTLRGWTQRELARNAHVDPGTLGDLLAQRRRPTFGTVQAICAALNLGPAQVIAFHSDIE
jgi:DNA-binding XRE family transcriptional regulator